MIWSHKADLGTWVVDAAGGVAWTPSFSQPSAGLDHCIWAFGAGTLLGRREIYRERRRVSKLLCEKKWMWTNSMWPEEVIRNIVQRRLVVVGRGRGPITACRSTLGELAALGEAGLQLGLLKKINYTKCLPSLAVLRLLVSRQLPGSKEQVRSMVISLLCWSSCLQQSWETAPVSSPQCLIHQPSVVNSFISPQGFSLLNQAWTAARAQLPITSSSFACSNSIWFALMQEKKLHKVV